jgi:hypothetical protein
MKNGMITTGIAERALRSGAVLDAEAVGCAQPAAPLVLAQRPAQAAAAEEGSPADRMRHRFPQPVRVGDLIGLHVLD